MGKLVVLKLDGSLDESGFRVSLEIGTEGDRPWVEASGRLPEAPELATQLQEHWSEKYRPLGAPYRIKPKGIQYGGSIHARIEACRESAQHLRDRLNQWLDAASFRELDRQLREQLNRDEEIRVLIRTNDDRLHKLPWHLWNFFDSYPQAEMALSPPDFQHAERSVSPRQGKKVRILAILGHGSGIDIQRDRELLENLPGAETVFLVEPQHSEINDRLWEQPWDVIFFAGHSETEGDRGRIHINPTESLTVSELWYALRKAVERGLQVAMFNSCDGLGLARQLDDLQIPITIVMRELIPDRVAQEFLKYFLLGFSQGKSFYLAVREARERLQGLESEFPCATWLPVVCQHPFEMPPTWETLTDPFEGQAAKNSPSLEILTTRPRLLGGIILVACGLSFIGWKIGAPIIARVSNNRWVEYYEQGDLDRARETLKQAIQLDPNNRAAHFTLGWLCEQTRNFQCAREKYQIAMELGLPAAYSNQARLYIILDRDYDAAVDLLLEGIRLVEQKPVRYSFLKNLGWARLKQERYPEASKFLQDAIELYSDRAPAYCLYAQVFEARNDLEEAITRWENCLDYARPEDRDEDRWIGMARQRLPSLRRKSIEAENASSRFPRNPQDR